MKKWLIGILFRLLDDKDYQNIDDKQVTAFLVNIFSSLQFREYFRKRDLQLLKRLGQGLTRDDYLITLGQRLEIMHLLDQSNKAYKLQRQIDLASKAKQPAKQPAQVEADDEIISSKKGGV